MKAIICTKYGLPEVLQLTDVEKPIPKDNEILIKNHAIAITISDCFVRSGKVNFLLWLPMRLFVGFGRPRNSILGLELSGIVESTGKNIKKFKIGDSIIAFTGMRFGAYAEYTCLPEDGLNMPKDAIISMKPENLTFKEAATVPSRGTLALYFLRKGNIRKDQKVLIYGASGGVGTFALQIAKYYGAEITGVCSSKNFELVKSLGASKVIDYTKEDMTKHKDTYDFIFDAVGKRYSAKLNLKKNLNPNGKFISVDEKPQICVDDLIFLKNLIETGKIKPVIDKIYPLEQIADVHRYIESGHKKGNVVISINNY
jgi:NADPH:quinone reductase-like Zn-dependent oxidoreductase